MLLLPVPSAEDFVEGNGNAMAGTLVAVKQDAAVVIEHVMNSLDDLAHECHVDIDVFPLVGIANAINDEVTASSEWWIDVDEARRLFNQLKGFEDICVYDLVQPDTELICSALGRGLDTYTHESQSSQDHLRRPGNDLWIPRRYGAKSQDS